MTDLRFDTSITYRTSMIHKMCLQREAAELHISLGEYQRFLSIRESEQRKEIRKIKRHIENTQFAQIRQLLARQNVPNNLNQLVYALHAGIAIPYCPDTKAQVFEANQAMQDIRCILMNKESMNEESRPL